MAPPSTSASGPRSPASVSGSAWRSASSSSRRCCSCAGGCAGGWGCFLQPLLRELHGELVQSFGLRRQLIGRQEERRSEEHTSELQSLMRISYAVFCLKKKTTSE